MADDCDVIFSRIARGKSRPASDRRAELLLAGSAPSAGEASRPSQTATVTLRECECIPVFSFDSLVAFDTRRGGVVSLARANDRQVRPECVVIGTELVWERSKNFTGRVELGRRLLICPCLSNKVIPR